MLTAAPSGVGSLLSSCIWEVWAHRPQNDRSTQQGHARHGSDISAMLLQRRKNVSRGTDAVVYSSGQLRWFWGHRGESRKVLNSWGSQSSRHIHFNSRTISKLYYVYIILYKACSLLPWEATAICKLYQFGFLKVPLINFGFYCVSVLKAEAVKLNVIAFDMGNGQ